MKRWIIMVSWSVGLFLLAWGLVVTTGRIHRLETKRARVEIGKAVQNASVHGTESHVPRAAIQPAFDFDHWEKRFKEAGDAEEDVRLAVLRIMEPWTYQQLETFVDLAREKFKDHQSSGAYDYWAFRLMAEKDPAKAMGHFMTNADRVGDMNQYWDLFRITFYHFVERDLDAATTWLIANHESLHRHTNPQFTALTLAWAEANEPEGFANWLQTLRSNHIDLDFHELFYMTMFLTGDRRTLHERLMRFEDTEIRAAATTGFVQATLEALGFDKAAASVEGMGSTPNRKTFLVKALVTGSANVAPESAANWLEANGTPEEVQTLLPDLIFLWAANQDHLSAEKWITAREPSPIRDAALRSFAKGAATKDLALAIRSANLIEDAEIRELALADAHRMSLRGR